MSKAVPWTSRSAGPNAHDAARRAARREGKSLGEWLHDTIVDRAEEFGREDDERAGDPRIAAVTARLERLSASQATIGRRATSANRRFDPVTARRGDRDGGDHEPAIERNRAPAGAHRPWRDVMPPEDTDAYLDEMISSIERRASQNEDRTGAMFASFAKMMEINEARRNEERQAVGSLSQKLSDLESRVVERLAGGDPNPIKGALARLEARLETIGKRSGAEHAVSAKVRSFEPALAGGDPLSRLEGKLDSILDAIGSRVAPAGGAEASSFAIDAARKSETVFARRSLAEAIGEIAKRQRLLDDPEATDGDRRFSVAHKRLGAVRRDDPGAPALDKIDLRLEALAGKFDLALAKGLPLAHSAAQKPDMSTLEELVRELGEKIEAAQAPNSDERALDALQTQVERLSNRFDRSQQDLSALPALAASVHELFDQLEATRASVEASAAHAAREVLRIAANDGRHWEAPPTSREANAAKVGQGSVEQRTPSTSATVEPRVPVVAKASRQSEMHSLAFAAMDHPRDPIVPSRADKRSPTIGGGEDAQRSDFIAAARRAAKTAPAEPSLAALQRPPGTTAAEKEARADLLAKSRDYVATNKRPVLMGLAAILMVLGTIAILLQTGLGGTRDIAGDPQSRIKVAKLAQPTPPKPASRSVAVDQGDLSPSALPKAATPFANAIPGSDPIQTGSIPQLPSFAARAGLTTPAQATLPAGLKAAAAAGDGAAEYILGVHYADGQAVPRDMKLAAQWFAKAADQGLPPAQYRLASMYEKGLGLIQDKARAKSLYTQAADGGNPRAMHNLAVLLADGDGHPDYASAAIWFRKAAGYGVHDSQYNLAILLARGLGMHQSLVQSYQWFAIAAAQNDADAAQKRDEVGAKLNGNDLAVAKALAAAFQPKIAAPDASDITPPATGWDGAAGASHINSAKSKVSSL